jgi:isoamylase
MLLGGDEMGRTQQGNNNAYCQDNEMTWADWASARHRAAGLHQAADRVPAGPPGLPPQALPRRHRGLRAAMVRPRGHADGRRRLGDPNARALVIYLDGRDDPGRAEDGMPLPDDDFLVLVSSWWEPLNFRLPPPGLAPNGTPRSTATTLLLPRERPNATLVIR